MYCSCCRKEGVKHTLTCDHEYTAYSQMKSTRSLIQLPERGGRSYKRNNMLVDLKKNINTPIFHKSGASNITIALMFWGLRQDYFHYQVIGAFWNPYLVIALDYFMCIKILLLCNYVTIKIWLTGNSMTNLNRLPKWASFYEVDQDQG